MIQLGDPNHLSLIYTRSKHPKSVLLSAQCISFLQLNLQFEICDRQIEQVLIKKKHILLFFQSLCSSRRSSPSNMLDTFISNLKNCCATLDHFLTFILKRSSLGCKCPKPNLWKPNWTQVSENQMSSDFGHPLYMVKAVCHKIFHWNHFFYDFLGYFISMLRNQLEIKLTFVL